MASNLMSIPLEVLLQITRNLNTPDYGNFRLTCKQIEATLLNAFSKEFFTKRQFMFTEFSLQALVDISKSRFASSLKHVIFGLERPSLSHFMIYPPGVVPANPSAHNNLLQEYLGHMALINTGQDVEMLTEAFSNLGNLETIGMRDFYSRTRNRDYPDTEWKSYGVPTFRLATGNQPQMPHQTWNWNQPDSLLQADYVSRVFLNLLRALGKANSLPQTFEVILRQISLNDRAFHLPPHVEPVIHDVLANLRTLFLDLNSEFAAFGVEANGIPNKCQSFLLKHFLSKIPQLEHLRLNFQSYENGHPLTFQSHANTPPNPNGPQKETNSILLWLSQRVPGTMSPVPSNTQLLPPPPLVAFTQLRRLDLGMTDTEPKILLSIVQKFKATLRVFSLHKIFFLEASSAIGTNHVNLWAKFFADLAKLNPNFSEMNMSYLSQAPAGKHYVRKVTFKSARNPSVRKWAANDIQSGLRDLVEETVVERLKNETGSEDSDDDSENMDDDEDSDSGSESEMDDD